MVQASVLRHSALMFGAHDFSLLLWLCLIFFAAGCVKGVLGMGLPTLAMGLLGLLMPVAAAASLLTLPSLVTNLWQAAAGPALARVLRRLWPMQLGIAVGVALAPSALREQHGALGGLLLGGCLAAYALLGLAGWRPAAPRPRAERAAGLACGAATGVLTALTGVFVLPAVPFVQSLGLDKDELTQALGLSFTTSTLALAVMLALQGHLTTGNSLASAILIVPALLGLWFGQHIRRAMSESLFRRCFFLGLLALGAWLLAR